MHYMTILYNTRKEMKRNAMQWCVSVEINVQL